MDTKADHLKTNESSRFRTRPSTLNMDMEVVKTNESSRSRKRPSSFDELPELVSILGLFISDVLTFDEFLNLHR